MRLEYTASDLESDGDDRDGLEIVEMSRARSTAQPRRAESELADRRIDLERLIKQAIEQTKPQHRQPIRTLLPYVARGYALIEAARCCGIEHTKAQRAWKTFCDAACDIAGEVRSTAKGKGTSARPDEYAAIRKLAAAGTSMSQIALQIGRSENFIKDHFERAAGYRRGSSYQRNPITAERVAAMKQLRSQGLSMAAIAKTVGCSTGSVCTWLNA